MKRLFDTKGKGFEAAPVGSGAGLMPDAQPLSCRIDRDPHVEATPAAADRPGIVEQAHCALGVDLAHEVEIAPSNGQAASGNQGLQGGRQQKGHEIRAQLGWGLAQRWGQDVGGVIPVHKERAFALDVGQGAKARLRPKPLQPQTVKGLDLVIAFGFVVGGEEGFDATSQTQADDVPQHSRMGMAPPKEAFVVELLEDGQAQRAPRLQQVGGHHRTALGRMLREADRVTEQVDGMEILHGDAPLQMAQDEVGGMNGIGGPRGGPGVIRRRTVGPPGMGQSVPVQHPLDGGFAGQRVDPQPAQLALNRPAADQAVASRRSCSCFADLAHPHDGRFDRGRHAAGGGMRNPRAGGKVGAGLGLVALPPFVQPLQRPPQGPTDVGGTLALQTASNRYAPQPLFVGDWSCHAPALAQETWS